ncbi:MAG: DUF5916 domain-containing protein [Cyclobacteriaceae bacterium]
MNGNACFTFLLLFISFISTAQDGYRIIRSVDEIILDGQLNEQTWENAQVAREFTQYFPFDSSRADSQTEIRMAYDDQFVYFSAKLYNLEDDRSYVTPSLRRDFRGEANDGVTLIIDPFQDQTNAFFFGINPFGVRREGLIANGGGRGDDLDLSWDNKWYGESKQYPGYWIAEVAIPFKTLRFSAGATAWNVNFYRVDSENSERSTWTPIPRNFRIISLAFMQELIWDEPLKKPGSNVSLIPYTLTNISRDFEDEQQDGSDFDLQVGGDAKIALTPSLNLDLTINPDFSQVEVDEQVTNLDRFEIFFPERRQFFLENADLFSDFGHPFLAKPFFSRRIGVARDSSTGQNLQNKIHYGARLSGKLDNNWRIGLLNMQGAKDENINLPSLNYTVASVRRQVMARSNVGLIFINKQNLENKDGDFSLKATDFNRVLGAEFNYFSSNGKWNSRNYFHKSFDEDSPKDSFVFGQWLDYQSNTLSFNWSHVYIGDNYNPELGFAPRKGIFRLNPEVGYKFYTKSGYLVNHGPTFDTEPIWNGERLVDSRQTLWYRLTFRDNSSFGLSLNQRYTYLLDDFDPTNTDGEVILAGEDFNYNAVEFSYQSDFRKMVAVSLNGYFGEFFAGQRYNFRSEINFRFQPVAAIRMTVNYNQLRMPEPLNDADLWLVGPRIDLTMTRKLFLTSFFQYNSQLDNININTRLQWRFKPVSDLFIVYTDNYGTDTIASEYLRKKNRALVLKLTYWLNL